MPDDIFKTIASNVQQNQQPVDITIPKLKPIKIETQAPSFKWDDYSDAVAGSNRIQHQDVYKWNTRNKFKNPREVTRLLNSVDSFGNNPEQDSRTYIDTLNKSGLPNKWKTFKSTGDISNKRGGREVLQRSQGSHGQATISTSGHWYAPIGVTPEDTNKFHPSMRVSQRVDPRLRNILKDSNTNTNIMSRRLGGKLLIKNKY